MARLRVAPISRLGGIQQSRPDAQPGDMEEMDNFSIFRGRLAVRAPIAELATLKDDQGTPQEVTSILAMEDHDGKLYAVTHSTATDKVYLHSLAYDGDGVTNEGTVWSSITDPPIISVAGIEGGTASSGVKRLYVADYNQNNVTRYWDGTSLNDAQEDFNNDSTSADITFSLVANFQHHLWGSGHFEEGASARPEMLRFSQPGLVPGSDIAGGDNPKEWFSADHREVGIRGEKITCLSYSNSFMMVFKSDAAFSIGGFDSTSWSLTEISDAIGCVGPHAATQIGEGSCIFWSNDGPYLSDGRGLQFLGDPIQQEIINTTADEDTVVQYSPVNNLVYFFVEPSSSSNQTKIFVFDLQARRWMEESWLDSGGSAVAIGAAEAIPIETLPGPKTAPSSLSATVVDDDKVTLDWTNGDTSIGTTTLIHRSTSSGFSPSAGNQVDTAEAGVSSFDVTGHAQDTEYFYQVRHERNSEKSSASNEASATTPLTAPSGISLTAIAGGIKIEGTQNADGADIHIERRLGSSTSWSDVTTLSAVSSGSFDHSDTTTTCGNDYAYRLRAEQTGSTSSGWTETDPITACATLYWTDG